MKSIASHVRDVLLERGERVVWRGEPDVLLEAYERFGGIRSHPMNKINAAIKSISRSKLFKEAGSIVCSDFNGVRQINHRLYELL